MRAASPQHKRDFRERQSCLVMDLLIINFFFFFFFKGIRFMHLHPWDPLSLDDESCGTHMVWMMNHEK